MQLSFAYQVTKWDPATRTVNPDGSVDWAERPDADGSIEAAYLDAISTFARELGVERLTLRDIELRHDDSDLDPGSVLARLFGPRLEGCYDGATVDVDGARLLVREALRAESFDPPAPEEPTLWCRFEAEGRMFVHTGYDLYLYIGASESCLPAVEAVAASGLFPVLVEQSPYDPTSAGAMGEMADVPPVDEVFWAAVDALVDERGGALLQEHAGWDRWHRVVAGGPRPVFRPRAVVEVWPDVSADVAAVLRGILDEDDDPQRDLVYLTADGAVRSVRIDEDSLPRIERHLAGAVGGFAVPGTVDEALPMLLHRAACADADGVVRVRVDRF
ncbi:hypothetical protein [Oerskovia merdavium]|uniref:RNA-binding protein n=1 Tax=Oerskovia merdavium TaxID=2762227 RepID=A0ABR8TVT9_9CELL|nr:hypothetical protein [Oerskovia merdavium]MBD7979877.1 hypothetical protein [Oerskovia merdavium]